MDSTRNQLRRPAVGSGLYVATGGLRPLALGFHSHLSPAQEQNGEAVVLCVSTSPRPRPFVQEITHKGSVPFPPLLDHRHVG